ncbi:MAG: OprO/OprP family phosphate-selective porin [Myxococcales bacterium]|nr:OprO/OprP family phosphate-selective porin [Myxococcales bacterium]MDH3484768.1 OprO/OprP family phosphate-selective porin [Myxococcales bacterium]
MRSTTRWIMAICILGSASAALAQAPDSDVEEDCDLDCIEAQLYVETEKDKQKKGVLEAAEEAGSLTSEAKADSGDSLASEPSTTSLAEVTPPGADERRLPTRLGPVRLKIGQTDDWIGFGFATQLEFDYQQQFPGAGQEKDSSETLQFRRIRLTLSSSFIDGRIRSKFQINATPSAFELIDMWLAFTRFKFATMRIGQFKIPYDRYRAQSFGVLSFADWASTTRMFGSERQIGIETLASGGVLNLEYAFGIFTGVNARASHAVGIVEVYGEVPQNPSSLGSGEIVSEFHPALAGRVAKNFGEINTDTNSDVMGSKELRHSVGVGFAWDARPNPTENLALRLSAEWLGKIRHFDINVITYLAWYEPWQGGKIRFGPLGVMGEVGYRFNLMWELAARYSITYLTPWLRSDARSYGEFQIANATDPGEALAQYGANGDQVTQAELAMATTAHIIGNSLKTVLEVAWENELWDRGLRNGLRITLQIQFLF